jgi:hypothetical protein
MRRRSAPLLALVVFAAALAAAAPPDVLSPLIAQPVASPDPVLGADGRVHLAYELLLVNTTPSPVTIDGVAALNLVLDDTAVETLQGKALADVLRLSAGGTGTTLGGEEIEERLLLTRYTDQANSSREGRRR